jgi:O-acetyl-ADP-ribose deacetylase (regulator of RNase III)
VIHAVGPIWEGGQHGEPALLAQAYSASIELALEWKLRRIAFPAISTGIFGYPLNAATKIAVTIVRAAIAPPRAFDEIVFACYSKEALDAYIAEGVDGRK